LIVGTVLTLAFVPALYAAWFGVARQPAAAARHTDPEPVPS
jgi:hypothetical protein